MDLRDQAMDSYTEEQHKIARTVEANAIAIARTTLGKPEKQPLDAGHPTFDTDPMFDEDDMDSMFFGKDQGFDNPFVEQHKQDKTRHVKTLKTDHEAFGSSK